MMDKLHKITDAGRLETALSEIARSGNFSHLSILSSGSGFHASFSPAAVWGSGHGFDQDPVEAALKAIEAAPKGPKSKKVVHSPAAGGGPGVAVRRAGSTPATQPKSKATAAFGRVSLVNLMELFNDDKT
jgi:hypothetical protein